jgi:hypothetical protein
LRRQDIDSSYLKNAFSLKNRNWYNNLSYRENIGNGWKMTLGASFSTNLDKIQQQVQDGNNQPKQFSSSEFWMESKNFALDNLQTLTLGRAVFEKKLGGLRHCVWQRILHTNYKPNSMILYLSNDNYTAAFAEASIYISKNWRRR